MKTDTYTNVSTKHTHLYKEQIEGP